MSPAELPATWRSRALELEPYAASAAEAFRRAAAELDEALRCVDAELLSPSEAAAFSNFSKRRLRELTAEGKLVNHGKPGAPRYLRRDLPTKSRPAAAFDASAAARELFQ